MVKGWGDYLSCFLFFFSFRVFACYTGWLSLVFGFSSSFSFSHLVHLVHSHYLRSSCYSAKGGVRGGWFSNFLWWGRGKWDAGFGRSVGNGEIPVV